MAYNPRKAAQVVAFFACKSANRHIDIVKAVKLVYLSDRESLKMFGFPILEEQRFSMPHGPVNSQTYSHMNGEVESIGWSEYLHDRSNHQVCVNPDASLDFDELSEADIECLEIVWAQFGSMGKWDIRDWTHNPENVPEWEDPGQSSIPIPIQRIMHAVGVINHVQAAGQVDDLLRVNRMFASIN